MKEKRLEKCPICNNIRLARYDSKIVCTKCGYIHTKDTQKVLVSKNWDKVKT